MQYDSTWLQEAGMQSLAVPRLSHSRADTTGDKTYSSSAFCVSRDNVFKNEVSDAYQQATGKSIKTLKNEPHYRHYCLLQCHKRPASVLNFFLV